MLFSRSSERKTVDLELQKLIDFVTVLFEVRIYASFICVAFAENLEYSPILWWIQRISVRLQLAPMIGTLNLDTELVKLDLWIF